MASGGIGPVLVCVVTTDLDGVADGVRRGWAEGGDAEAGVTVRGAAEVGSAGATGPGTEGISAAYGALFPLRVRPTADTTARSEEHTSELQSQSNLVCRLLLEKKKKIKNANQHNPISHYIQQSHRPHSYYSTH